MIRLKRTVRFTVNPRELAPPDGAWRNGYAGSPAMRGLGTHYELHIECVGRPDPKTGYLINIKDVDLAARETVVPGIVRTFHESPTSEPAEVLPPLCSALNESLDGIVQGVRWNLTPTYSIEVEMNEQNTVLLRQRFDFAASHRLHVSTLSDEENRHVFGVCNNLNGHGHNYQVEPCVSIDLSDASQPMSLADLEQVVGDTVIDRFDHKNLNVDTREFKDGEGVNPSVEHIARVCFGLLEPAIASRWSGARLRDVTVWETDRTSCTFPAGG